ncbi:MAG: Gfo/Idh/MocA family oxidoreductase [Acidobacteria bacterium]|nr:Gfo/Idh/MocA family oxidoreductase [Acidobacteriota bacterium]MCI0723152.1 Gfo/Idh/MocA family oxidoreductase [Acidobacteriota bacterium]
MQLVSHLLPETQAPFAGIPQFKTKHVAGAQVVALADVYEPSRDRAAARFGPGVTKFHDYRKLLEQKDIDAVIIGSPDHWHKQMLIDAVEAGKDAYVEKPVSHSLAEGPEMIRAVEKTGRIVQTGTQHRSWSHYIRGKEIIDSGALGNVRLVESYWFLNYRGALGMVRQQRTDLSKLDWKAWLGSAPPQPFSEMKFRLWRYYWDFGGGALTDLLTHAIDTIQWYMDSPTPSSAIAVGHAYDFEWECPDTISCTLEYPKGFLVTYTGNHATGIDFGSIIFRGSKGILEISRAALAVYEEDSVRTFGGYNPASQRWRPQPKVYVESEHEGTADNLRLWLESIRSRKTPNANIRVGVEAARAAHIGNAALLGGKKARWNEEQQEILL